MDWIYFQNEIFFEKVFLLVIKTNSKYFPDTFVCFLIKTKNFDYRPLKILHLIYYGTALFTKEVDLL